MKIIGVVSGKGGVGKTTTVANLGAALFSELNRRVLLVDGNFSTPDLGLHLGIYSFSNTLEDVLRKKIPAAEAIYSNNSGINVMSTSLSTDKPKRPPSTVNLKKVLQGLKKYEWILVDSAPGIGKDTISILKVCDEVLVVTNPELPAINNTLKMIKTAETIGVPVKGVILNKVRGRGYEPSISEIDAVCNAPVIASIPDDVEVIRSISDMNPVVLNAPNSPAAIEFKKLAAHLVGKEYKVELWGRVRQFFRF